MLNQNTPCLRAEELRQYSEGRVDDALRFRVEEHILDCPLCEAAVEGYAAKGHPGSEQVKQELEQLKTRITAMKEDEVPATVRPMWFNRAAAAVVALLVITAAWLYWNHTADERLFASVFEPGESDVLILRGEEDAPPEQAKAIQLFQAGSYEAAIPHFKNYLSDSPEDFSTTLRAGIAAVGAGQTAQAVEWLEMVRFNDFALYGEATWYLALAYWKQGNKVECTDLLQELAAAKDREWADKAATLLEQIK